MKYFTSLMLYWLLTSGASPNYVESNVMISQKIEVEVSECSTERAKAYKTLEEELLKVRFSLDETNKSLTIQSDVGVRNFQLDFESTTTVLLSDDVGTRILAEWQVENGVKILKFKEDPSNCFAYWVHF